MISFTVPQEQTQTQYSPLYPRLPVGAIAVSSPYFCPVVISVFSMFFLSEFHLRQSVIARYAEVWQKHIAAYRDRQALIRHNTAYLSIYYFPAFQGYRQGVVPECHTNFCLYLLL